jgi:CDP-diacylglycerol--serine O-phosphatidyltransferase
MRKQIPNFITLLNLYFGCLAIMSTFEAGAMFAMDDNGGVIVEIPAKLFFASLYIGLAGLMDFFDGFAARLLKVSSDMGKQLDSLADIISFGLAPAFIVFQFLRLSLASDMNALTQQPIGLFAAFLIPMAGAYRLARFNLDVEQTTYFKGVPIPMIGILTAAFPLIYWQSPSPLISKMVLSPLFWFAYIFLVSFLMVMKRPMLALKSLGNKKQLLLPLLLVVLEVMVTAFFYRWLAIPFGFIGYCLVSLFYRKTITQ